MTARLGMLAITLAYLAGHAAAQPFQYLGAGSCAATACHNGNFAHGNAGSEYTLWITRDRHAKAYETLFNERSKSIQRNLGHRTPAHEDRRCLTCHVTPDAGRDQFKRAPYFRSDGVSCESCHGPAQKWLNVHHLPGWRGLSPAQKAAQGMHDTRSLSGRAQGCAGCHVGAPGMDVDHDLIAAGHPRLTFELSAYHAFMPRHWPNAKDRHRPDFEARLWALGQIASARAALELLADRAQDDRKAWPEFAQHDCVACHHDLRAGAKPRGAGKLGAIPWNAWDLALTPRALRALGMKAPALDTLEIERSKSWGNRQGVGKSAHAASAELRAALARLEDAPLSADIVREILADDAEVRLDHALQAGLALAALQRSIYDRPAFDRFWQRLKLPASHDSAVVRLRLSELKRGLPDGR